MVIPTKQFGAIAYFAAPTFAFVGFGYHSRLTPHAKTDDAHSFASDLLSELSERDTLGDDLQAQVKTSQEQVGHLQKKVTPSNNVMITTM